MTQTTLTSEAKEALRKAVRGLRGRLIDRLDEAAEGEYRLRPPPESAQLPEARRGRRERLRRGSTSRCGRAQAQGQEAEQGRGRRAARAALEQAVKEAAYTLLNRLVLVRILEHPGCRAGVVTRRVGQRRPTRRVRRTTPAAAGDDTRGYAALLHSVRRAGGRPAGLFGPRRAHAAFSRFRRRPCAT